MSPLVETSTPPGTPRPIGPYNHIARVDQFISIGGTAGVNPATNGNREIPVQFTSKQCSFTMI